MKIPSFQAFSQQAQIDAKAYIANHPVAKYQPIFANFNWNDLYSNSPRADLREAYEATRETLVKELATPIAKELVHDRLGENDFHEQLNKAEDLFHYRFLAVIGKSPEELNPSWFSKSLSRTFIEHELKAQVGHSELLSRASKWGFYNDQEGILASKLCDISFGDRILGFNNKGSSNKYPLKSFYREFSEKAEPAEFLSVMLNMAGKQDGLRPTMPIKQILDFVVSEAAIAFYGDENVGMSDISRLRSEGVVKSTHLWDTKYFNESLAPVNSDEMVAKAKERIESGYSFPLFDEIKDKLSRQEIFSYVFNNGNRYDAKQWGHAMAGFEAITGERLSFQEARDIDPNFNFQLSSTQPFSDRLDSKLDPDSFRKINSSFERELSPRTEYEQGERVISIVIECNSLSIEKIERTMIDEMLKHPEIKSAGGGQGTVWYEAVISEKKPLAVAAKITDNLVRRLDVINKAAVLPGDLVKVTGEEASEWELTIGTKAVVTDVHWDGQLKLKGDKQYYSEDLFSLQKKYQPAMALENSPGR